MQRAGSGVRDGRAAEEALVPQKFAMKQIEHIDPDIYILL
jgi:hypothetical protein